MTDPFVIAGGGLAAQRAAETLRRCGLQAPVVMVCAEPHRPYDRPPLSKSALTEAGDDLDLHFRPPTWYADQDIALELGVEASGLEPAERRLQLADGRSLRYGRLLIATGARPRRIPRLDGYANVSVLRTVDEARVLRDAARRGGRLAVIGAGFIGLEVASAARQLGLEVSLVEAMPGVLGHVLGERMAGFFEELHRAHGVDVRLGRRVTDVVADDRVAADDRVRALVLDDGSRLEADHVLVGVGVAPETGWLAGTGLNGNGVRVDAHGRTPDAHIFAAGDAAATFDPLLARHSPGSHWEAAGRQGARAARAMLGLDPGHAPMTSFWTDQYGLRIQYLGHAALADQVSIDGALEARDFAATFTREGRPVAVLLVNRPAGLPAARAILSQPGG